MGFGASAGSDFSAQDATNRIREQQQRLAALATPAGKEMLLGERVADTIKTSPIADKIGRTDWTNDFLRGWTRTYTSARVGWNDVTQDKEEYEEWRSHLNNLQQYFPGSTGARYRGGMEAFFSDVAEGVGSSAPQAIIMAGTAGAATPFVAGSATALQVGSTGITSYGEAIADADNRADALRKEADKLDGGANKPRLTPEQAQTQAAELCRQADKLDQDQRQALLAQAKALRQEATQYAIEAPESAADRIREAEQLEAQAKLPTPEASNHRHQAQQLLTDAQQPPPPPPSPEAAQQAAKLRAEADRIQANRRVTATTSAGFNILADRLAPLERLPFNPTPGSYVRRLTNATGKSLVENATTTTGNQVINNAAYGDPMDAGRIAHDTALGTVSGLPLTAGASARGQAPHSENNPATPPGEGPATHPTRPNNTHGNEDGLQFSQPGDNEILNVHRRLAENEDAFQFGKTKPDTKSIHELAQAFSVKEGKLTVTETTTKKGEFAYKVTTERGSYLLVPAGTTHE